MAINLVSFYFLGVTICSSIAERERASQFRSASTTTAALHTYATQQGHVPSSIIEQKEEKTPKQRLLRSSRLLRVGLRKRVVRSSLCLRNLHLIAFQQRARHYIDLSGEDPCLPRSKYKKSRRATYTFFRPSKYRASISK